MSRKNRKRFRKYVYVPYKEDSSCGRFSKNEYRNYILAFVLIFGAPILFIAIGVWNSGWDVFKTYIFGSILAVCGFDMIAGFIVLSCLAYVVISFLGSAHLLWLLVLVFVLLCAGSWVDSHLKNKQ